MIYPKIEDCVHAVGCKYTLTVMLGKRVKDLTQKMPGEFSGTNKELTFALGEVLDHKIAPAVSANQ